MSTHTSWVATAKRVVLGRSRQLSEEGLFHRLSLVAVLAWVGLGADGLSSSCYGPEEIYRALLAHPALALLVAAMTAVTVLVISASYAQIISLFPNGGGGYVVASRLLSPTAGVVSGSALLIDYVLTIAISVASAMDAVFSLLPPEWAAAKVSVALVGVALLTLLNLRGVKESVLLFAPIFFLFVLTHGFAVVYAMVGHGEAWWQLPKTLGDSVQGARSEWGTWGLLFVLLRAYAMGAGTYTGIEAVSNGLPILREPRVRTGLRTMTLMGLSLAAMAGGLLLAYVLTGVQPVENQTLNATLLQTLTAQWSPTWGRGFVSVALVSAAALLFIAAQAGFIDGPRVLANMALDRWMPARFAGLSDRFVTLNGVLLMGGAAALVLWLCHGSVAHLVVLYSINVFLTFTLSQLGMVRHGWRTWRAERKGRRQLAINAVGLVMTSSILVSLVWVKFFEGGWVTLLVTFALVLVAFAIKRHYDETRRQLARLDAILGEVPTTDSTSLVTPIGASSGNTAVIFVNGFNGLGLHTLLGATRLLRDRISRYVFVQVGVVDAGNFKGAEEIDHLREHVNTEVQRYVQWVQARGGQADGISVIGHDVVAEVDRLAPELAAAHPNVVFFGGQLVFARENFATRWLHNYTVFSLQRKLFLHGLLLAVVPVRVGDTEPLTTSAAAA